MYRLHTGLSSPKMGDFKKKSLPGWQGFALQIHFSG
jgi:hypothetical protein